MKFIKQVLICSIVFLFLYGFKPEKKQTTIFSIGDSTMANKEENKFPETGWGQVLPQFFDSEIGFQNHAKNGRSSKSFLDEGLWQKVYDQLKPGDFVLIQFGHNDQKDKSPDRFTNPYTGYRKNLKLYIDQTREKGAIPVLLTSIVRRNFNEDSVLIDTHGAYTEVARTVAKENNVAMIDLQMFTEDMVLGLGIDGSKSLYLQLAAGENPNYPNGAADNTHLNRHGATVIAEEVAKQLSALFPQIAEHHIKNENKQ